MEQFDYIVIGAGSAGCVLARRLVDAGKTVCLLESGPVDNNPFIHIPAGFIKALVNKSITWRYRLDGNEWTNHRRIPTVHGRTLGGSSSVNGMVYVRGQRNDYDGWAERGNKGWSFAEVLPYFKRIERRIAPANNPLDETWRGRDGALPVTDSDWTHPVCDAFIEGALSLGIPRNPDTNGASQDGAGYYQRNIQGGRRISAARAFLHPVRNKPNLSIRTDAHATALVFDGRRATGVCYMRGEERSNTIEVRANCEVIVAAGAVGSPRLLQVSGIGPAHLLAGIGVPVLHDLPGVGENLRDHFSPRVIARARNTLTINNLANGTRLAFEIMKWMTRQPSILALSAAITYAFCRSDPALSAPDTAVIFTPGSYKEGVLGKLDEFPGMTCGGWQLRPNSSGHVRARSPDPFQLPEIQPNHIADERDRRAALWALRMARRILATPAMAHFYDSEVSPGRDRVSDEDLLEHARSTGTTCAHLVGTCRMGPESDPTAVVDEQLRVRGLDSLRIADASIMPMITSGNTYAPTLMIADKASDLILGRG